MVRRIVCALLCAGVLFVLPALAWSLDVGDTAPAFEAESTMGTIRLADYQGKKNVLLAFYFKDFTGG